MNLIQEIEAEQLAKATANKTVPEFSPGDTVRVNVRVVEGNRERVQAFEGVCIAKKSAGINSAFTVRKLSYGEGVERVFPLFSPRIDSIEVVRRGRVRRAKLYYLRGRTGKAARISEKSVFRQKKVEALQAEAASAAPATAAEAFESDDAVNEAQAAAAEAAAKEAAAAKAAEDAGGSEAGDAKENAAEADKKD